MLRRSCLWALVVAGLLPTAVMAQAPKTKILFLTESKGFKHGSVNRDVKDGVKKDLSASEVAMTQLGKQTGLRCPIHAVLKALRQSASSCRHG